MLRLTLLLLTLIVDINLAAAQENSAEDQPPSIKSALQDYDQRISNLQKDLDSAVDAFEAGKRVAHDQLIEAYRVAIKSALSQKNQILANSLSAELATLGAAVPQPVKSLNKNRYYESVLGAYGLAIRGKRIEYVNLKPPARDLLSDSIRSELEKHYQIGSLDYIGTANIIVLQAGDYSISIPDTGTQLRINGHLYRKGTVALTPGRYEVEIYTNSWGQPYMQYCEANIANTVSGEPLRFVNTGRAIKRFTRLVTDDKRVRRINTWTPVEVDVPSNTVRGVLQEPNSAGRLEKLLLPEAEPDIEDIPIDAINKVNER